MSRLNPHCWRLWALPRGVIGYVAVVEAVTLVLVVLASLLIPVTGRDWWYFGALLLASTVHFEAAQGSERVREVIAEGGPYTHLQSVWYFAGVLVLPLPLLFALIAISFAHEWFRVFRGRALAYRKVFSAATVLLAVAAAVLVLVACYPAEAAPYVAVLTGWHGTLAVIGSGIAYEVVNYTLVVGAIVATNPDKPTRSVLGPPADQLIIVASLGLGYAVALFMVDRPWSTPILLITVLSLNLGLLLPQFRKASRTDASTGLADPVWWSTMAEGELDRAGRLDSCVGVLMLDLDQLTAVEDRYGQLAVDAVRRAVADVIRRAIHSHDLASRWGNGEFVVLLPGVNQGAVAEVADRMRAAVGALRVVANNRMGVEVEVAGLTLSIGAGAYPYIATELSPLLLAVDDALFQAKRTGRDRTVLAMPNLFGAGTE